MAIFSTDPRFANPFVERKDMVDIVKRTAVTAGVMLKVVRAGTSQTPAVPELPSAPRAKSHQTMIERFMSFDRNADRRISREELPERMQGLVARGDKNADADLDWRRFAHSSWRRHRPRESAEASAPSHLTLGHPTGCRASFKT